MNCPYCGTTLPSGSNICPNCGSALSTQETQQVQTTFVQSKSDVDANEKASGGLIALSIIIPIVGIIMGIVFMATGKKHAGKVYLLAGLISTGVGILFIILGSCIGVSACFNALTNGLAV